MVPVCTKCQQNLSCYIRLLLRSLVRRITVVACLTLILLACLISPSANRGTTSTTNDDTLSKHALQPISKHADVAANPVKWLQRNSNKYAFEPQRTWSSLLRPSHWSSRPRAAVISLVRNEELDGIMQSMRQLEYHWNHKFRYPWIFLNEQAFSDTFKASLRALLFLFSLILSRQRHRTSHQHPASTKWSLRNIGTHPILSMRTAT